MSTCTNFGLCQPLNSTVPGFKNTGGTLGKGKNGFCNPPIPPCKDIKQPSKFGNPNTALDPPEKRGVIQLF